MSRILVQETFAHVLSRPRLPHGDEDIYHLTRALRNTFLNGRRAAALSAACGRAGLATTAPTQISGCRG
jgi:hypothetical protein